MGGIKAKSAQEISKALEEKGIEMLDAPVSGGEAKVPMMLSGNDNPGFKIGLHIKDLANAIETAHDVGMGLPLTAQVMEMLQTLKAEGLENKDHSALAYYYQKLTEEMIKK